MSVLLSPLSLQAADIRRSGEDTFIIQQQRQEALEQQLTPSAPDVRLSAPGSFAHKINFPVETPCFQIKQTELKGADALPHWLPLQKIANGAVGHCLGAKGINLLMSTLQNRLVDHGYVTTRVLAPSQDLKSGILRLVIIPGVVRHVRLTPDSDDIFSCIPHSRHTKVLCWIYGTLSRGWRICNDCRVCRLIWKLCPVSSQGKVIFLLPVNRINTGDWGFRLMIQVPAAQGVISVV
ncbi:HecB-like protein [Escherichia coli]|nr:HecB-like protein [Escherichia coli]